MLRDRSSAVVGKRKRVNDTEQVLSSSPRARKEHPATITTVAAPTAAPAIRDRLRVDYFNVEWAVHIEETCARLPLVVRVEGSLLWHRRRAGTKEHDPPAPAGHLHGFVVRRDLCEEVQQQQQHQRSARRLPEGKHPAWVHAASKASVELGSMASFLHCELPVGGQHPLARVPTLLYIEEVAVERPYRGVGLSYFLIDQALHMFCGGLAQGLAAAVLLPDPLVTSDKARAQPPRWALREMEGGATLSAKERRAKAEYERAFAAGVAKLQLHYGKMGFERLSASKNYMGMWARPVDSGGARPGASAATDFDVTHELPYKSILQLCPQLNL